MQRSKRESAWAERRWSFFQVVESDDGAVWIAEGSSGRVERLDAAGAWQSWALGPFAPADLVPAPFGAVCGLEELEMPDRDAPPGAPLVRAVAKLHQAAAIQATERYSATRRRIDN